MLYSLTIISIRIAQYHGYCIAILSITPSNARPPRPAAEAIINGIDNRSAWLDAQSRTQLRRSALHRALAGIQRPRMLPLTRCPKSKAKARAMRRPSGNCARASRGSRSASMEDAQGGQAHQDDAQQPGASSSSRAQSTEAVMRELARMPTEDQEIVENT